MLGSCVVKTDYLALGNGPMVGICNDQRESSA